MVREPQPELDNQIQSAQISHDKTGQRLLDTKQRRNFIVLSSLEREWYCANCLSTDFKSVIDTQDKARVLPLFTLHTRSELDTTFGNGCKFCRSLREHYSLVSYLWLKGNFPLAVITSGPQGRFYNAEDKQSVLGLYEYSLWHKSESAPASGYLCWANLPSSVFERQTLRPRVIELDAVDFNLVRGWLCLCQSSHGRWGDGDNVPKASTQILVINCESLEIEIAQGKESYAALSYVWGGPNSPKEIASSMVRGRFVGKLEVSQAMTITKQSQMKYLWVDRYCIPQSNEVEKHK